MSEATAIKSGIDTSLYAGANWLPGVLPKGATISPLGCQVADLLGWVWQGLYHLDFGALRRADWSSERYIQVCLSDGHGNLSSFDGSRLTRLVLAAHDLGVRVDIRAATHGYLYLYFLGYPRDGGHLEHPTIEAQIERMRRDG